MVASVSTAGRPALQSESGGSPDGRVPYTLHMSSSGPGVASARAVSSGHSRPRAFRRWGPSWHDDPSGFLVVTQFGLPLLGLLLVALAVTVETHVSAIVVRFKVQSQPEKSEEVMAALEAVMAPRRRLEGVTPRDRKRRYRPGSRARNVVFGGVGAWRPTKGFSGSAGVGRARALRGVVAAGAGGVLVPRAGA